MHTEHLQNVRWWLVAAGWLIGIALASLLMMVIVGLNLVDADSATGTRIAIAAVALGFFAGGLFAGLRGVQAPILHGTFIGLLSLVAWFLLNALSAIVFPDFGWQALTPNLALAIVLVMIVSAILGARAGYRRGQPR